MRITAIIIFLGCLVHCGKKDTYVAPLSDEQTVNLLVDLHISEAALARLRKSEIDSARYIYHQQILNKFELTEDTFNQYYTYLKSEPDKLQDLYKIVYDSIESKGKKYEAN